VFVVLSNYDSIELLHRPRLEGIWTSPVAISPLNDIVVRNP
jgi:hypothetical protein